MSVNANKTVQQIFGLPAKSGDVGIEIEAEARNCNPFPTHDLPVGWNPTHDNSLRGISIEYVLNQPVKIDKVEDRIMSLQEAIKNNGTKVTYTYRAGVHVHINCQKLTMKQVLVFAALYYSIEEVLVEWCGSDRVGNFFCLRARDAEGVLDYVGSVYGNGQNPTHLANDAIRYAALNFCALPKYGSLEFRSLATTPDFEDIVKWATLLYNLREKSKEFESIPSILERFSMASPTEWLQEVLGDFYEDIKGQKDLELKVWEGIRFAQDLLFFATR